MELKNKPWESQKGESDYYYEVFEKYRDMGRNRNYAEVARLFGTSKRTIAEIARKNDWVYRSRLFDDANKLVNFNYRLDCHHSNLRELVNEKNNTSISFMSIYREIYGNYLENGYKLHDDPRANSMIDYYTKLLKLVSLLNKNVNFILNEQDLNRDFNSKSEIDNYDFSEYNPDGEECNLLSPERIREMKKEERNSQKNMENVESSTDEEIEKKEQKFASLHPEEVKDANTNNELTDRKLKEIEDKLYDEFIRKNCKDAKRKNGKYKENYEEEYEDRYEDTEHYFSTKKFDEYSEIEPTENEEEIASLHLDYTNDANQNNTLIINNNNKLTDITLASFLENNCNDAKMQEEEIEEPHPVPHLN